MQTREIHRDAGRAALAWCLAASGFLVAPHAAAQGVPGLAEADDGAIIVTAQRRSERLEDVPASIQAISGEALKTAQITRFQDLQLIAPSVQISRTGTQNQPAIRGVTTTFAGGGQETNVAVYVDGFYNADPLSINQDFANISSVEILKGPQGTLYGRNATGGAILITTRSPGNSLEMEGAVSYAPRFNDRKVEVFVGGPLDERTKLSVAGYFRKNDGYFTDINNFAPNAPIRPNNPGKRGGSHSAPFENWSIHPKLEIDFAPVKLTLSYKHAFLNDSRSLAYRVTGHVPGNPVQYNGYPLATEMDTTSLNFQPVNRSEIDEYQATAEIAVGNLGTVTSRTGYRKQKDSSSYDLDATPRDPASGPGYSFNGGGNTGRKTFTQQVDFASSFGGSLSLLAGLFYYNDEWQGRTTDDSGSGPGLTALDYKTEAWAAYLDGTYNVGDLYITVGGRYSEDRKNVFSIRTDAAGTVIAAANTAAFTASPDGVVRYKSSAFTPRAVIRYNLTPESNIYASISRGFKSGTISSTAPYNALKPEKVTAYEIGYKASHGGLRADIAAFYYDFKDSQVSALDPTRPLLTSLLLNAGGSKIYGIDTTLSYRVTERLNLRVSLAYLHARYRDFENATNTVVNPATGLNTSVVGSWSGRRIVRSPDWSGSASADYTADFAGGQLVFSLNGTFSSRYATSNASYDCDYSLQNGINACNPGTDNRIQGRFEENGYVLANGQIAWTDASDRYTLTVFATNLTNTRYKTSTVGLFYGDYISFNEPRVVGGSIRVKY
ncbi:MAG: TonB-dependent receptor [Novosphingobium sp.]